jgi:G3E family GTPase
MASGCLCCTIRGDLVATLEDLLRRRDNDRINPFNRIMIETTGLADPAPILHTIMYHPYFMLRFRLDGVISVVDAINGDAILDRHPEAVKQAAVADRIVITKTDLLSDDDPKLAALRARLAALNPTAVQLDAAKGEATPAKLLNAGLYDPDKKNPDVRRWLNAEALDEHAHEHHHHDHAHAHDVNRHDVRIRAFALRHPAPVASATVDLFFELLRSAHGAHLLRVKGIIALADDPSRPLVVHGVQHIFHPPVRLDAWPDEDHTTRIVFILYDMEPSFIEGMWKAFAGLATDTPDAVALTQNPLKIAPGGLLA